MPPGLSSNGYTFAEYIVQVLGELRLLRKGAVHLERKNERELRRGEGIQLDCDKCVAEVDLRGERFPVLDDRLAVGAVPAVQFDAAAALKQHTAVHTCVRARPELVAVKVRVVAAIDEVGGERLRHIVRHRYPLQGRGGAVDSGVEH